MNSVTAAGLAVPPSRASVVDLGTAADPFLCCAINCSAGAVPVVCASAVDVDTGATSAPAPAAALAAAPFRKPRRPTELRSLDDFICASQKSADRREYINQRPCVSMAHWHHTCPPQPRPLPRAPPFP